jgi:hypothetical protein
MPAFKWAKSAIGTYDDFPTNITTDANGNMYVIGTFTSPTIAFDTFLLSNEASIAGSHSADIFLVKYNNSGNVLWASSVNGASWDVGKNVYVDSLNNVLITGAFSSSYITFGTDTLYNTVGSTIFIAKYDANGNFISAKSALGTIYDTPNSITFDQNGNSIIVGSFQSDTLKIGLDTLINAGGFGAIDIFVAKYDSNENTLWARSIGDVGGDNGINAAIDSNGNVYVIGFFDSPYLAFGTDTIYNDNPGSTGAPDVFIAKFDVVGNPLWLKGVGGTSYDYASSITLNNSSNLFITGRFDSPSIIFGTDTLYDHGNGDVFIAMYDSAGNSLWATNLGGTEHDNGSSITSDKNGNVFISGYFYSPSIIIGSSILTNAQSFPGIGEVFIAKLSLCGITIQSQPNNQVVNVGQKSQFSIHAHQNNAKYQWQSDIGFGFQNLTNAGQYRGVRTDTLSINNISLMNDNQYFRCIVTSDSCPLTIISATALLSVTNILYANSLTRSSINISPNPTNSTISITGLSETDDNLAILYNAQGKVIMNFKAENNVPIDLSLLDNGVYLLKVGQVVKRVVKMFL